MADIDPVNSATNSAGNPPIPDELASQLIHDATNPATGEVDTQRLAASLSLHGDDFGTASQTYAQVEAQLSAHSPVEAAQFSRDVVDYFAKRNITWDGARTANAATPTGLTQLLEHNGITVPNVSNASASSSTNPVSDPKYGNIPTEHQARYDRYLQNAQATGKNNILGPNEWYAAAQRAWANNKSGNGFELQVRQALGGNVGPGSKPDSIKGYVPDLPVNDENGVTDIKNVKNLTDSPQLTAFGEHALAEGKAFNLIVGPKTQSISGPLLDRVRATGGSVTEYDPSRPSESRFKAIDIGESGAWKRSSVQSTPSSTQQTRAANDASETPVKSPAAEPEPASTPELKTPALEPESPASGAKGGAIGGAIAGTAITAFQLAVHGKLDSQHLGELAQSAGTNAAIGVVASKGEQLVTPVINRAISSTVQQSATKVATTAAGEETAAALGGTLVSRVAGATVVGAAISTGISAWENREGLAHGDSKAIGNVVADTTVAAGSIAAATAAGAAFGSIVPGAGTLAGAAVGLGVGLAVTYGAQISGARDAIADGAAHAVDGIKSAARDVAGAASSMAHFFGF